MMFPSFNSMVSAIVLTGLIALSTSAAAHRMDHAISTAEAQVLTLSHAFGDQPVFEPYQIFAPDSTVAFQNGRTDALGRISFLPDRPGRWRVVVTTEDGHGLEVRVRVDEALEVTEVDGPAQAGIMNIVAGVGYLLGLAGLLALWRQRKKDHAHP
jgi:nickel transport protein